MSFVFPTHLDGVELLKRSVAVLEKQTDRDFEVVIAVDVPRYQVTVETFAEIESNASFDVQTVISPRTPKSAHLPHRNHARNAGCRAARGQHLWVLDCDMLADPRAVEHLKAIAASAKAPACVSPCFAEPNKTPSSWLTVTTDPWKLPYHAYAQHSGRPKDCTRTEQPSSLILPHLVEGFPSMPRWIWNELGGYCEKYVGYGGNKVDLVRQLVALAGDGIVEMHLLTSCLFLHQPHERDSLRTNEAHRARNWEIFRCRESEIQQRSPWWAATVDRVRENARKRATSAA